MTDTSDTSNASVQHKFWLTINGIVIATLVTVIGWLATSVIAMQSQMAADSAEDKLRQELTDVLNNVDTRLKIIEVLVQYRPPQMAYSQIAPAPPPPSTDDPAMVPQDQAPTVQVPSFTPNQTPLLVPNAPPASDYTENMLDTTFDGPTYDLRKE